MEWPEDQENRTSSTIEVEQALEFIDALIFASSGVHLNDLQQAMLRESWAWQRQSYDQIARTYGYSDTYLKHDVGPKLWRLLSSALGEKVTKKNFRAATERRYRAEAGSLLPLGSPAISVPMEASAGEAATGAILSAGEADAPTQATATTELYPQQDWEEAVDTRFFYGRQTELTQLQHWIEDDHCRLIALLGMGGMGKTSLSAKLAQRVADGDEASQRPAAFQFVVWRSLRNSPPLSVLLPDLVNFVSNQQEAEASVTRLLYWLRTHRCLVILDNVESILQGAAADRHSPHRYRTGYEDYGELFRQVGDTLHASCLLLTSREKPPEIALLEGETLPVRSLRLSGLSPQAGQALVSLKGAFHGSEADWHQLITGYVGNPLALKMIATTIQTLFDGSIADFLQQQTLVFGSIQQLIEQQFERLSATAKTVLYWLAIYREPAPLSELRHDIFPPIAPPVLIETLETLEQRSLIDHAGPLFSLQPVIMEYVSGRLVSQMAQEISAGVAIDAQTSLLKSCALLKTQAKDYIREHQIRLLLQPILQRLRLELGDFSLTHYLLDQLSRLRGHSSWETGYAGGNLLNLLCSHQPRLRHCDLSHLTLWHADLESTTLHDVNLTGSDLSHAAFTEPLGMIFAVAFHPDGTQLAIGDAEGGLRLWQVAEGKLQQRLDGHSGWVWAVAFSADGRTLASCSSDKTIRLWDTDSGQARAVLRGHSGSIWAVAFSPNGERIASGGDEPAVLLWNRETGAVQQRLSGHSGRILSIAFSLNEQLLASGSEDGSIRLWSLETEACRAVLTEHTNRVWSVAFSPDGRWLASGSADQTIRLWDLQTGDCRQILRDHRDRVRSVQFSPDGQCLVSASDDQTLRIWDLPSGACLSVLRGHRNSIFSAAISDRLVASGSADQTVKLWSVSTGRCLKTLRGYTNSVFSLAVSTDGTRLASSSTDQTVKLWQLDDRSCLHTLQGHSGWVTSVAFHPDGQLLASSSADSTVRLWSAQTGQCLKTLTGHTHWVQSVAFSPDGSRLASGGDDRTLRLWSVQTGQCLASFKGHRSWIWAVAFSPNGDVIASSSDDGDLCLWSVATGDCLRVLTGHRGRIQSIAFSPDGELLASGSGDETVRLWSLSTGECLQVLHGHQNNVWSVTFSSDGRLLASGSLDQTVKIWQMPQGTCVNTLSVCTHSVRSAVIFAPATAVTAYPLATGNHSGTIHLWDALTGDCLGTLTAERPYEGTVITDVRGLTLAQKEALKALGAVDTLDG